MIEIDDCKEKKLYFIDIQISKPGKGLEDNEFHISTFTLNKDTEEKMWKALQNYLNKPIVKISKFDYKIEIKNVNLIKQKKECYNEGLNK